MNINKLNLEISQCASKEEGRYHLNGVHFTKDYTESTNGHVLGRITYPTQMDIEELPAQIKSDLKDKIDDFIVPLRGIKDLKFPQKVILPILQYVYVDVESTNKNGVARFSSTDLETTPVTEIRKIDGEFPETDRVWPKEEEAVFEICIDSNYLKIMADIASKFSKHGGCKLTFYGIDSPVKIHAYNSDTDQTFTGVIMPMKGDARDFSKPKIEEDPIVNDNF